MLMTKRKRGSHNQPAPNAPIQAMSIAAFCKLHSISQAFYFKLKRQGRTPREMRVGQRILISQEAARAWRVRCEDSAANTNIVAA
jgi:hypothetical protein